MIKDFIFIKGSSIKMNKNSNKANQERFAAMRLAEINATDKEDLMNCVSDMEKTASLDVNEAVVVAKAIRAKYLPNIARQAGLDVSNLDLDEGKETVDFANDESDDEDDDMEFHHFESDDDLEDDEASDDWEKGEEDDSWDPDFEEFDVPKSKTKKAPGKKGADEDDDFKFEDDEFKDLFDDEKGFDDDDDY